MTDYIQLIAHPETPPLAVAAIAVKCWHEGGRWRFRYRVEGKAGLVLPQPQAAGRADGLWRTTCFEAFVGAGGTAYTELNFAPSGEWAAYAFDSPRAAMRNADAEVQIGLERGEGWLAIEAAVTAVLAPGSPLGLSAVLEEEGGVKSYWALAHPDGLPDFHDPSCFIARLPE